MDHDCSSCCSNRKGQAAERGVPNVQSLNPYEVVYVPPPETTECFYTPWRVNRARLTQWPSVTTKSQVFLSLQSPISPSSRLNKFGGGPISLASLCHSSQPPPPQIKSGHERSATRCFMPPRLSRNSPYKWRGKISLQDTKVRAEAHCKGNVLPRTNLRLKFSCSRETSRRRGCPDFGGPHSTTSGTTG